VISETQQYLDLLERRIDLLNSLADALKASSADVVSLDIDSLESRIIQQERLCLEIHALNPQLDRVQRQCAAQLELQSPSQGNALAASNSAQISGAIQRLQRVQASVQQLNNAHQSLLRRSRRTVGALLNSYHSFAMTYSDPALPGSGERL
jgi:hypothetical protein